MAELPFSMNRVEDLIRAILWLTKREWGLAFLLACPSLLILAAMSTFVQDDALFEGPVFPRRFLHRQDCISQPNGRLLRFVRSRSEFLGAHGFLVRRHPGPTPSAGQKKRRPCSPALIPIFCWKQLGHHGCNQRLHQQLSRTRHFMRWLRWLLA